MSRLGGGSCYWNLKGKSQECYYTSYNAQDSPLQQRIIWPKTSIVLRLRNPSTDNTSQLTAGLWTPFSPPVTFLSLTGNAQSYSYCNFRLEHDTFKCLCKDICKKQGCSFRSFQIFIAEANFMSTLILFNFRAVLPEGA